MAPVCGYFADRLTYRKVPMLLGLAMISGATVMLCLATTLPLLILGRMLQGASSAVIWVVVSSSFVDGDFWVANYG